MCGKTESSWSPINMEHQVNWRSVDRRSKLIWLVIETGPKTVSNGTVTREMELPCKKPRSSCLSVVKNRWRLIVGVLWQALSFNRQADELELWMDEVESQLSSEDHGKDIIGVTNLLKKHQVPTKTALMLLPINTLLNYFARQPIVTVKLANCG